MGLVRPRQDRDRRGGVKALPRRGRGRRGRARGGAAGVRHGLIGRMGRVGRGRARELPRGRARAVFAIAAAVWFFGASFGLLAWADGWGVLAPFVMSLTTFAGSAQFAAVSILGSSGSAAAAIVAAVLLNARYVPISISVASLFHGPRPRRFAEAQLIVDESWAISSRGRGRFD